MKVGGKNKVLSKLERHIFFFVFEIDIVIYKMHDDLT